MQKYPSGNLGNALLSATDLIYYTCSLVWMQKNFSSNLRVYFKVKFIAAFRTFSCVDLFKLGSREDRCILFFPADTISGMESRLL